MATMPMFPLGSVLFPHMPLRLRVFEPRYLMMLSELLNSEAAEFGVVLIERGQEVGGGEQRFGVGTVARIVEVGVSDGFIGLVAQGDDRIEVAEWLKEDPHPRADVRRLPELDWDPELQPLLDQAERVVRRSLAVASEFEERVWTADVELAAEPLPLAWQLAGIAPLGPLDQLALLRSTSIGLLLESLIRLTQEAAETWSATWGDELG
jgi:Lon protease-like protein